ncbi:MAG: Flp pilus assembly protein CpaB [Bacillota bacterium]|jgi:pilus assembly protein CpaB
MAFKSRFWILATFLVAVIAGLLVYRYLDEVGKASVTEEMTTQVLARIRIPAGTEIQQEMLESKEIPAKYASSLAIKEIKEAVGKYAATDILPGSAIVAGSLTGQADAKELPFKIPAGMRAIAVPVDEVTGVAGFIKPGHRVDVITVVADPEDRARLISLTLIQDALVLAVGPDLQKRDGVQAASTVTIAVTPDQAQIEALSERTGTVRLSVRPMGEGGQVNLSSVDVDELLRTYP